MLMNVFFAVLLNEFSRAYDAEKTVAAHEKEMRKQHDELMGPLDPLLDRLMSFENELQLEAMITQIFQASASGLPVRKQWAAARRD